MLLPILLMVADDLNLPGMPGAKKLTSSATINKIGKSISFTSAELHQGDKLVATASATNKFLRLQSHD